MQCISASIAHIIHIFKSDLLFPISSPPHLNTTMNSESVKTSKSFRFNVTYLMPSTFFFTDFLYSPHDLHDCSRGQTQIYETNDALSLDSPNTVC